MSKNATTIHQNRARAPFLLAGLIVGGVAVYVADLTLYRFGSAVHAWLGLSVVYLAYLCFVRLEKPDGFEVRFPRDLKYLPFAFVFGVTVYWAGMQIYEAVCQLLRAQ